MGFPKINVPVYETALPSGKKIKFRPFLVKEEKLLLIAKQSDDVQEMVKAVQQIIQNCLIDESVESLPLFDIEFLFLQLIARSIGEVHNLNYRCNTQTENGICGKVSTYPIDLLTINPKFGEGHEKSILLTDKIGITLDYPSFKTFNSVAKEDLTPDEAFQALLSCVNSIFDENGVYYMKDIPEEEFRGFMDSLTPLQVKKIDKFFDTIPKIETVVKFNCPGCGTKEDIVVTGLESFFV